MCHAALDERVALRLLDAVVQRLVLIIGQGSTSGCRDISHIQGGLLLEQSIDCDNQFDEIVDRRVPFRSIHLSESMVQLIR